jgi:hypothetical protein
MTFGFPGVAPSDILLPNRSGLTFAGLARGRERPIIQELKTERPPMAFYNNDLILPRR